MRTRLLALWIWESLRLMAGLARHQAEEEILNEIVAREVAERIEALKQENTATAWCKPPWNAAKRSSVP